MNREDVKKNCIYPFWQYSWIYFDKVTAFYSKVVFQIAFHLLSNCSSGAQFADCLALHNRPSAVILYPQVQFADYTPQQA